MGVEHLYNPLTKKLQSGCHLTAEDVARLDSLIADRRVVAARTDLIREGQRPSDVHLVLSGFAYRQKTLHDGRRQIMAILVPGDFCDLHVAILGIMDHAISTVSECVIVTIPQETVLDLVSKFNHLTRALWWATLVDEAILREWLVNLGQRSADRQLAHLFCELHLRLKVVGLADDDTFALPMTQAELADTLGLTTVHINRMMQQLRSSGLIATQGSRLVIPDPEQLQAFCAFDPTYLHRNGLGRHNVQKDKAPRLS